MVACPIDVLLCQWRYRRATRGSDVRHCPILVAGFLWQMADVVSRHTYSDLENHSTFVPGTNWGLGHVNGTHEMALDHASYIVSQKKKKKLSYLRNCVFGVLQHNVGDRFYVLALKRQTGLGHWDTGTL